MIPLVLTNDMKEYKIRLEHIDAPEKTQDFGQVAKKKLSEILWNEDVKIIYKHTDRYGRIIGEIYKNNLFVNEYMIRNGYAWWYKKYSTKKYLGELQDKAKENHKGLWATDNPINPENYRRKK